MNLSRTNPMAYLLSGIIVILLIVALASFPAGAAASVLNQMETPMAEATLQPTETPLPGGWSLESGTPSADDITSSATLSMTNCPMMSGGMMGNAGSMQGMNLPGMNMSGMTGMQGGSMMGMSGTQGGSMPGMAGMQGGVMPGMTGMTMPGMSMPGMPATTSIASANPYENPWYLLGWALLALVSLTVLGVLMFGIVWIIRRSRSTRQV